MEYGRVIKRWGSSPGTNARNNRIHRVPQRKKADFEYGRVIKKRDPEQFAGRFQQRRDFELSLSDGGGHIRQIIRDEPPVDNLLYEKEDQIQVAPHPLKQNVLEERKPEQDTLNKILAKLQISSAYGKRDLELGRVIKRPVNFRINLVGKRYLELGRVIKRPVNLHPRLARKRDQDDFEYGRVIKREPGEDDRVLEYSRIIKRGGNPANRGQDDSQLLKTKQKYSDLQLPGDFRIMKK